jgi:hypothetical protein
VSNSKLELELGVSDGMSVEDIFLKIRLLKSLAEGFASNVGGCASVFIVVKSFDRFDLICLIIESIKSAIGMGALHLVIHLLQSVILSISFILSSMKALSHIGLLRLASWKIASTLSVEIAISFVFAAVAKTNICFPRM